MNTRTLPRDLYRADEVRALDRCAIEEFGIPGITLMERAGQAAFAIIQARWPRARRLAVLCGAGNNGGDGYVVASLARRAGLEVRVLHVGPLSALAGDALAALRQAQAAGVPLAAAPADGPLPFDGADLVVDALLGTGLRGAVRPEHAHAIAALNEAGLPVLALDVPSGLCADTGAELGVAVRASATVTFVGLKRGLFTGRGPALCGKILFDGLLIPPAVRERVPPRAVRLGASAIAGLLPPRERDAHKGHYGHVLVVGGEHGFAGAALMAAEAAARAGAGLVSVATRPEHVAAFVARRPEAMAHAVTTPAGLEPLLARATVVVAGPGLGTSAWSRGLLARVRASGLPRVLDADALNLMAQEGQGAGGRGAHIVTPHPGEAARLLGIATAAVQADRYAAARALQAKLGGVVLLKGAGTIVDEGEAVPVAVCTTGNPGMASGGMGDVLSGLIAGLVAQGLAPGEAARLGAVVHGAAADRCARQHGERGLLATDLLDEVRHLVNGRDANGQPRA